MLCHITERCYCMVSFVLRFFHLHSLGVSIGLNSVCFWRRQIIGVFKSHFCQFGSFTYWRDRKTPQDDYEFVTRVNVVIIFRRNFARTASNSAYNYTFLCSVVCLCVVCRIHACYLNHSTDLDAIWQVPFFLGERRLFWVTVSPLQQKHTIANCGPTVIPIRLLGQ